MNTIHSISVKSGIGEGELAKGLESAKPIPIDHAGISVIVESVGS